MEGFDPGFPHGVKYQALYLSDNQVCLLHRAELKVREPVQGMTRHIAFLLATTFLYILSGDQAIVWCLFPTNSYSA